MDGDPPRLEWWPERRGLLWHEGRPVELDRLGLPGALLERLRSWCACYCELRLPGDGPGDVAWLEEGIALLAATRAALRGRWSLFVAEPWWGEEPEDADEVALLDHERPLG